MPAAEACSTTSRRCSSTSPTGWRGRGRRSSSSSSAAPSARPRPTADPEFRRRDPGHRRRAEAEPVSRRRHHHPVARRRGSWRAGRRRSRRRAGRPQHRADRRRQRRSGAAGPAAAVHLHLPGAGQRRRPSASPTDFNTVQVDARLTLAGGLGSRSTDSAWIQLVKSANPFMLDLANGNDTPWLSSDLGCSRSSPAAPGSARLATNASRAQALDFLRDVAPAMTRRPVRGPAIGPGRAPRSARCPTTTGIPSRKVYNFAVARVRLSPDGRRRRPTCASSSASSRRRRRRR